MNHIISIDPDKDPRWDLFVGNHPLGWVVHLSGWKKLLERCFPHMKGHYLALCNSSTHELKAALPLFVVRSWLTGNRLVSIPMAQLNDPLVESTDDLCILLEAAFQLSQRLHTSHIELIPICIQDDTVIFSRHGGCHGEKNSNQYQRYSTSEAVT